MKMLMLGGSKAQLPAILKAQELGHQVITCDYLKDAVGHDVSDISEVVSTFDVEAVQKVAQKYKVDGIMTMGTDQPVYTVGMVANALGLPMMISKETALSVTNKKVMKEQFIQAEIDSVKYCLYKPGQEKSLEALRAPYVVKPLDSQGQRGIYFLKTVAEVKSHFDQVIRHSRCDEILIEEYYEHDEITVSGWVDQGEMTILSITDRVTFKNVKHIGICLSHEFPSKHITEYGKELKRISNKIVQSFNINNGPIYFQFLIGKEGIKVNEIACRIGGAFEATFLPEITGFDICKATIKKTLGETVNTQVLAEYNVFENPKAVSVQLFFMTPCEIRYIPSINNIRSIEGVLEADIFVKVGDKVMEVENATSRAGYVVLIADNPQELQRRLEYLYQVLRIEDDQGKNHIVHREGINDV